MDESGDSINCLPDDLIKLLYREYTPSSNFNDRKKLFGVQFHPEVIHSEFGMTVIKNFVYKISNQWLIGQLKLF